ncbi:MAG: hypothetical protein ABI665_15135 [Vicinamibacterales bacterium]
MNTIAPAGIALHQTKSGRTIVILDVDGGDGQHSARVFDDVDFVDWD